MNKIAEYLSTGFILLFAAPTVLIMASWGSLPGDPMFGVKRAFEGAILLAVRPSYETEATLNAQFTKRRMEEAKVLLAKNQSSEGLSYLSQQIKSTKKMIQRAPTEEKKREAAKKYIATLKGVSQELKTQQKSTNKPTRAAATSQSQLQAQLRQQLNEVREMQSLLGSHMQDTQTQQLLAQLSKQAQQLEQLQQQLSQQTQPQVDAGLQSQINQGLDNAQAVTTQVSEIVPSTNTEVAAVQDEIDDTIADLTDITDQPDIVPDEVVPTATTAPTSAPTATPTNTPAAESNFNFSGPKNAQNDDDNNNSNSNSNNNNGVKNNPDND